MVIIHKKHKETDAEIEQKKQKAMAASIGIQDDFQAKGFEMVSFVQAHKGMVCTFIVLVILGGAFFSAYTYMNKRSAEEASSAYLEAIRILDAESAKDVKDDEKTKSALEALKNLSQAHPKAGIAALADLYAGHLSLVTNNPQEAVRLYQNAVASLKKTDSFYTLALISLGYALEKNGQVKESRESFEKVLDFKSPVGEDVALWEAARLAHDAKDGAKAKEYLDRLHADFPASVYERQANSLRELLQ